MGILLKERWMIKKIILEPLALMMISILVIIMNGFVSYAQFEEKNADFDDHSPEDQSFGTAVLNFLPSILDPGKCKTCRMLSDYRTINVRQKSQMKIKPSYAGRSQPTKQSSSPRDLPTLRAHQDQREPNVIISDNNKLVITIAVGTRIPLLRLPALGKGIVDDGMCGYVLSFLDPPY